MYGGGYIFNPDSEELTVEEEQIKLAEFEARIRHLSSSNRYNTFFKFSSLPSSVANPA